MSKNTLTFVRGVFIGCAVATLLLIASSLLSRGISLSLESIYGGGTNNQYLAEGRSLLSVAAPSAVGSEEAEVTTLKASALAERESVPPTTTSVGKPTGEEQNLNQKPKKPLLTVVTTSLSLLERTSHRIRTTWGSETANYRIVVGAQGTTTSDVNIPQVLVSTLPDFPSFPYLSIGDLSALLDLVRSNFLEQYNWFLIAPSNTYVSVQRLERFLQGINPYKVVYIGHPSSKNMPSDLHYCEGGPGIIFSHMALQKMRGRLQQCVRHSKGDLGYRELGKCLISELKTECYLSDDDTLSDHFLYDQKLESLTSEKLLRKESFQQMLTLYPVHDQQHIELIHTFNQATEIASSNSKASTAERKLLTNQLCLESPKECKLKWILPFPNNKSYEDLLANCHLQSRGYIPEIRRKVEHWDTITGHTSYNSWNLSPQELVHGPLSKELKHITSAAVSVVKKEIPGLQLVNMANMYVRYRGTVGREYILDMELNNGEGMTVERRVSLLLPHMKEFSLKVHHVEPQTTLTRVNFIIPMDGLNRKKTAKFQRNFYSLCVRRVENCRLVYVLFSNSNSDVNFMRTYLTRFKRRHAKYSYEYIVDDGKFDLARAYDLGLSKLNDSELAFIGSIEVSLADHFLTRCRANTMQGSQLYYPELFMYYNMPYVYRGKWHPRNYDYSRVHGRWATRAILCIYKSDYTTIGGYSTFEGWEVDPTSVQSSAPGSPTVFKAPDPGISHWYEATHCNSALPPDQFSRCLSTQSDNLADRLSLAGYLLALENKCGNTS